MERRSILWLESERAVFNALKANRRNSKILLADAIENVTRCKIAYNVSVEAVLKHNAVIHEGANVVGKMEKLVKSVDQYFAAEETRAERLGRGQYERVVHEVFGEFHRPGDSVWPAEARPKRAKKSERVVP